MWTQNKLFQPQDPRNTPMPQSPFDRGKSAGYKGKPRDNPFISWAPEWCDWEGGYVAGELLSKLDRAEKHRE